MHNKIFYLLILVLTISCTTYKGQEVSDTGVVFPDSVERSWTYLAGDGYVPYPKDFILRDSLAYVLGLNRGRWLHIFDLRTGAFQGMHITRGQQFGQLENPMNMSVDAKEGNVCMLDNRYDFKIDIKYFSSDFTPVKTVDVDTTLRNYTYMRDMYNGRALVVSPVFNEERRWSGREAVRLMDTESNKVLSSYDGREPSDTLMASLCRHYSLASSQDKLAAVINHAGAIELYKIAGDSITRTFVRNYFPVDYIYTEGSKYPEINRKIQYGFRSVAAGDDYVYASYSESKEEQELVNEIGVWDWNGNPVKKIITDKNIIKMAVSSDGKRLYGVTAVPGTGHQLCYIDL